MRERTILAEEVGVLYRSPSRSVLWAFEDLSLPVKNANTILDVLSGEVINAGPLLAKKHRVYAIQHVGPCDD